MIVEFLKFKVAFMDPTIVSAGHHHHLIGDAKAIALFHKMCLMHILASYIIIFPLLDNVRDLKSRYLPGEATRGGNQGRQT